MRWAILAVLFMLSAGARSSSAGVEYWFDFQPVGTMGGPVTVDVSWPMEPSGGVDWRSGIYVSANLDDHDSADVYEVDTNTWDWDWVTEISIPGSPEATWTCSWGKFRETNSDTAVDYAAVTWIPTEPFQDSVRIDCEVDDPYDTLGPNGIGDRDDEPDSDYHEYDVRWPATINVTHRRRDVNDPALDAGNIFGYYNVVEVLDNFDEPFSGLSVTQDMANPALLVAPRNSHADSTAEGSITWLHDVDGTTDVNGKINRFDLVQGDETEAQREVDSYHYLKRAYVVARSTVKRFYWNPFPSCSGTHTRQYVNGLP